MLHIAICDDEKHMSDHISVMSSGFFRKKNREIHLQTFSSGEELLSYGGQIDILFLDIQMKDMDGMETARTLRADNFRGFLIFITVLKEMVFQSFEVQAYDYLVKPVEEKQFEKTMERLYVSMKNASEDSLLVQKGYEGRIVPKDEIVFCEIIDRKVYLNLASGEVVDYYERIGNLETKLAPIIYIIGVAETSLQLYFLAKMLKRKLWSPFYILFATGAVIVGDFFPVGTFVGFAAYVLLFSTCEALGCHETDSVAAMLICEAASFLLIGFCLSKYNVLWESGLFFCLAKCGTVCAAGMVFSYPGLED